MNTITATTSFPFPTNDASDNWYGVHDTRKRKQIQNRLAQRARRQRLAKHQSEHSHSSSITIANDLPSHLPVSSKCMLPRPTRPSLPDRSAMSSPTFNTVSVPTGISSSLLGPGIPPSAFAALFSNGAMMGLTCGSVVPAKSTPQPPHIPLSLQPTALQLTTIHAIWIDRFPFPRMRDNMITLQSIIEEEEFLRDLFFMESFSIKERGMGWDPQAWTIGKEFGAKWGYLFY